MNGEYISRSALLLQYYAALGELMEESRRPVLKMPVRAERVPEAFELGNLERRAAAV